MLADIKRFAAICPIVMSLQMSEEYFKNYNYKCFLHVGNIGILVLYIIKSYRGKSGA